MVKSLAFAILVFMTLSAAGLFSELAAAANSASNSCDQILGKDLNIDWVTGTMNDLDKGFTRQDNRLRRMVQKVGIGRATLNDGILLNHDNRYLVALPDMDITNQNSSGRCWAFSGGNSLRAKLMKENKVDAKFQFSQAYLHFFSQLERSNIYLEKVISALGKIKDETKLRERIDVNESVSDGGFFMWFAGLVEKYGIAPQSAMPETASSDNTAKLQEALKDVLTFAANKMVETVQQVKATGADRLSQEDIQILRSIKTDAIRKVLTVLKFHLGDPPSSFNWIKYETAGEGKDKKIVEKITEHYTPLEFAQNFVGFKKSDYVMVSFNPRVPTGTYYEVLDTQLILPQKGSTATNVRTLNMTHDDGLDMIDRTLDLGWFAPEFDADIRKDTDFGSGVMHPGIFVDEDVYNFPKSENPRAMGRVKAQWIKWSYAVHAMVITAKDKIKNTSEYPILKLRVDNTWGKFSSTGGGTVPVGDNGRFHMYPSWFRMYVDTIVVPVEALTEAQRAKLAERPKLISIKKFD